MLILYVHLSHETTEMGASGCFFEKPTLSITPGASKEFDFLAKYC